MTGTEGHFRQMVGPALAQVLFDVLRESSGRARTLSAAEGFVEARTEPTVAFDFSVSGLEEQLDALRVKRLDKGCRPSSYPKRGHGASDAGSAPCGVAGAACGGVRTRGCR